MTERKVAIVTGAASGIGKATALEFVRSGYSVFLVDHNIEKLEMSVLGDFHSYQVDYSCGDVSLSLDVERGLEKCLSRFSQIDVLVANAAIMEKVSFLDMSEEQWDHTLGVNLKGVFLWGQAVARWMVRERRKGKIINIACMRSELATLDLSAYIASKGGVKMLTKAMAVELAPYGITVNAISPGRTITEGAADYFNDPKRRKRLEDFIPLRRLAAAEDIARVISFLVSPQADYITGSVISVDGGYTCFKE